MNNEEEIVLFTDSEDSTEMMHIDKNELMQTEDEHLRDKVEKRANLLASIIQTILKAR